MGIGGSIKKGFSIAVTSWPVYAVFALFGAVANVFNGEVQKRFEAGSPSGKAVVIAVAGSLFFIIAGIFLQAGALGYIRDKVKQGAASVSVFIESGGKYFLRFFLFGLLVTVVILVAGIGAALGAAALPANATAAQVAIFAVVLATAVLFVVFMVLAPYIIVTDESKTLAAVRQSFGLVKKNFMKIVAIGLILLLIGFGVGLIAGALIGLATFATQQTAPSEIAVAIVGALINAFLGLFMTGAFMNFYLGLKKTTGTNPNNI